MKKTAGYTLIELSIALVILGIVIMLVWRFVGFNSQYAISNAERGILRSADAALTGFALSNNRMPCPDTTGDGIEDNCATGTGAAVGRLPNVTIGLSQATGNQIRYGVYRGASVPVVTDADLAVASDRIPMLKAQGTPLAAYDDYRSQRNGIDLCVGLRNASNKAVNPALLHVVTPEGNINVAYALAIAGTTNADGVGGLLDANNASASPAFEAPSRVNNANYDDRVVAVGFDRLLGRLNCNEALAAVTHGNANAATAAEMMRQSMLDYKIQLDWIAKLAEANYAGAIAGVALAAAAVALGAAEIALAIAETLTTTGAQAPAIALAIAAEVAALIALVSASVNVDLANDAWDEAKANVTRFLTEGYVVRSATLATEFRANTNAADAAGTY
jgi:prepilin-type N-terminal cleavage/methylation domain-containing protein